MARKYTNVVWSEVMIKGIVVEVSKADPTVSYERLLIQKKKKDGSWYDNKVTISTKAGNNIRNIEHNLVPLFGEDCENWSKKPTINKQGKMLFLLPAGYANLSEKDQDGIYPELALHNAKRTILLDGEELPSFTNEEVDAMRPRLRESRNTTVLPESAPVVNTGSDF
jgi:ribosomal protein S17